MALDLWHQPVDVRLVLPGPIDTEIWDRPGSEAPLYDGPKEPPSVVADAIVGAIEGDGFEVYAPTLKAVVEWKTTDPDGFLAGAAAMGAGRRGGRWSSASFPRSPPPAPPTRRRLVKHLASTPMDLREVPDPVRAGPGVGRCCGRGSPASAGPTPSRSSWTSRAADDSPMTAFISFPQVLGHEVVATVEAAGRRPASSLGQRVVLNPWLSCEVRGIDPVCPGVRGRRPVDVLALPRRRPRAGHPHR